jgi:hypothetical protein
VGRNIRVDPLAYCETGVMRSLQSHHKRGRWTLVSAAKRVRVAEDQVCKTDGCHGHAERIEYGTIDKTSKLRKKEKKRKKTKL